MEQIWNKVLMAAVRGRYIECLWEGLIGLPAIWLVEDGLTARLAGSAQAALGNRQDGVTCS